MNEHFGKTLLNAWHIAAGANMAGFCGYEMPLWYDSAKNEHLAVLTGAGVFDTSHMASVTIGGPDAFKLLQYCFTNDMNACVGRSKKPLFPGRCVYGAFLEENGHVIDDTIIYMIADNRYMAVVNAGMGGPVAERLESSKGGMDVEIENLTGCMGKMDIQGPLSAKVMAKLLKDPNQVFSHMPYFSFKGGFGPAALDTGPVRLTDDTLILLSRTGYTGEFGFEIFTEPDDFVKVWKKVLAAGEPFGVSTCGLAARDSLRAGAVLPLSHQDIGHWPFINHPWPFALPFNERQTGFTKSFAGCDALLNVKNPEYTHAFAGFDPRKVSTPASVLDSDGAEIGTVLTCATDMALNRYDCRIYSVVSPDKPDDFKNKGLCCGFVKVDRPLNEGDTVYLKDARRKIKVWIESDIRPDRTARKPIKEMPA